MARKKASSSTRTKVGRLKMTAEKLHRQLAALHEKLPHGYKVEKRKKR